MQLRGNTISFNGINSSRYGLYLCSTNDEKERDYGITRSIEKENGVVKNIVSTEKVINLQLVKLDSYNNPLPISEDELFEINRWLFSPQDYKPLIVDQNQIVYYGMFVKGSIWQNEAQQGYLTLEFELNTGHCYSVLQNSDFRVNGTRNITLNSKNNYSQYNEIDIEIKLADGQNSITIENLTTGQKMVLKNLPNNCQHIYVYNEGVKHISNVNNKSQNLRPYFNKEFIHLAYGVNNIKITGVGKVRFISQAKVLLQ